MLFCKVEAPKPPPRSSDPRKSLDSRKSSKYDDVSKSEDDDASDDSDSDDVVMPSKTSTSSRSRDERNFFFFSFRLFVLETFFKPLSLQLRLGSLKCCVKCLSVCLLSLSRKSVLSLQKYEISF